MKGSIYLLRANAALTTNCKLVVASDYAMYLESYSANKELSDKRFKRFPITPDSFISERIASFYQGLPTDIAYNVKNDIKSDTIQNDFDLQFDDMYYSGPRNVEDTRYTEEFQYNTTLKIDAMQLPLWFFVFRSDGPGIANVQNIEGVDGITGVRSIIENFKLVSTFDLSQNNSVGKLWNKNYITDDVLPRSPFELNLKRFEFSKWNGYDYYTGGSVTKSFFMDEYLRDETLHFETEAFITDGFKKNGVVAANYLNVSYLFDDTVSGTFVKDASYDLNDYTFLRTDITEGTVSEDSYSQSGDIVTFNEFVPFRKRWTINRYFGFYLNSLQYLDCVSPYTGSQFKDDATIEIVDNVFMQGLVSVDPTYARWDDNKVFYFKIGNKFYLVEKAVYEETSGTVTQYIIVSDELITDNMSQLIMDAQDSVKIVYEQHTDGSYYPYLKTLNDEYYTDPKFDHYGDSVLVIDLFDKKYVLNIDDNGVKKLFLQTDEYIVCDGTAMYRKRGYDVAEEESTKVVTKDDNIQYFKIYVCEFTPVSDWDFNRTKTRYAEIEYDKSIAVNYSRPFLHRTDIADASVPRGEFYETAYNTWLLYVDPITLLDAGGKIFDKNDRYILPLSSEYAFGDLYVLDKVNKLSRIWDVNQSVNKWGYANSINNSSYPYKLNNSLTLSGQFNMTPNAYVKDADINSMTLDWFYTIGVPTAINMSTYPTFDDVSFIKNRSLNIDVPLFDLSGFVTYNNYDRYYKVNLDYYKSVDCAIDYFGYIFNLPVTFNKQDDDYRYYERIAYFNQSDGVNGPAVFFKGLNAYVQWVDTFNPNSAVGYSVMPADDLSGYGFSVMFDNKETDDTSLHGKAGIEVILNKKYKNILVYIYVYTPFLSVTSLHFRMRDEVYTDEYVQYVKFDVGSGLYDYVTTELPVKALTLCRFIEILSAPDPTSIQDFSMGIEYSVIEDKESWTVTGMTCVYDAPTDMSTVSITLDKNLDLKHSDWVYIKGTGFVAFDDMNHQIVDKTSNTKIKIALTGDRTADVLAIVSSSLPTTVVTKEVSVLPFRLQAILPEVIRIDQSVNIMTGDTSCPVVPVNNTINNNDLFVNEVIADNTIPYVYFNEDISRKLDKVKRNRELTYTEVDKLPTIYRHSGDYEPILNNIELFAESKIINNRTGFNTGTNQAHITSLFTRPDGIVNRLVLIVDAKQSGQDVLANGNFAVADLFYIFENNDDSFTTHQNGHVVSYVLTDAVNFIYEVTTSMVYDTSLGYTETSPLVFSSAPIIKFRKFIMKNTAFEYGYNAFGVMKDVVVAKVYQGLNPMRTSQDVFKTSNRFPLIDEHGVTSIDRFIFKSSWDDEFYYRTDANRYDNSNNPFL